MDFSLYCYNFFLILIFSERRWLEFCVVKGLSVLFDEQDIKTYPKIIEICLILKAIKKLASCDSAEGDGLMIVREVGLATNI